MTTQTTETLSQQATSKRQFLKGVLATLGAGITSGLVGNNAIATALNYPLNPKSHLSAGKVFNQAQLTLLKTVCDLVLPRTDTPSAGDVDVHGFIDNQLFHCYEQATQNKMIALITMIETSSKKYYQHTFDTLLGEKQTQLLVDIEQGRTPFTMQNRANFKQLKALICFGYYTSEVGASQELNYQAFPGGFTGSIKSDEHVNHGALAYY